MAGRPLGSQNKDKPYRDALRMELASAGENSKELRAIARAHIAKAKSGDMQAIKEFADRIDGKVPQAVGGVNDEGDLTPLESTNPRDIARAVLGILREAEIEKD